MKMFRDRLCKFRYEYIALVFCVRGSIDMVELLPTVRRGPFDPPPELGAYRESQPLRRLMFGDGHVGWLVTSHKLAKSVLADSRFSARAELQRPEVRPTGKTESKPPEPARAGSFIRMDPPEHTRYRRLLTRHFTVRRMNDLEPRVEQIVDDHLSAMEAVGPPVDLVEAFARPVPSLVISELLGVPEPDRQEFQEILADAFDGKVRTEDETTALQERLLAFITQLIHRKRAQQGDGLLSALIGSGELTDKELEGMIILLLSAGHETTTHMLSLGTLAILSNPDQFDSLRRGQACVNSAVEELLRYLTIFHFGITRTALVDVELHGEEIKACECVSISLPAANRDPSQFDGQPDTLDLFRRASGHLAFGHGIHQCLGQQLARVQMRVGYGALFRRFPTLRVEVPSDEIPIRDHVIIYGLYRLPVAW